MKSIDYLEKYDWIEEIKAYPQTWQITDEGRMEYERRKKLSLPQPTNSITIQGSNGSVVNFGTIGGNLNQNIQHNNSEQKNVLKAIEELTEAIKRTNQIQEEQKQEYLETLQILKKEALKPNEERIPSSILKQSIKYLQGTLNTLSSIATITGATLPTIMNYFTNPVV